MLLCIRNAKEVIVEHDDIVLSSSIAMSFQPYWNLAPSMRELSTNDDKLKL